ncbi:MAG: YbfB/YjiJ family MFS transporter [Burkholderiales bacterium]|nr:YbfB/YjiJ family MFS transporter [Burkholderiales bacterium]
MNGNTARSGLTSARAPAISAWRVTLAGFCASLVGIGIARFAYTPLLPAIIGAHWFAPSAAAYLGAANLAGYLGGALSARPAARAMAVPTMIRAMMALATAACFACALPVSFLWFFLWRFASGLAGGALMVLAAPAVLPHVAPARRGLAGGVIFMGVGVGIAASGTLVPLLLRQGLMQTWLGLGVLSLLLTLAAWRSWPRDDAAPAAAATAPRRAHQVATLRALYAEYALNAVGLVPHMIFLVDFVARGLGLGLQVGAEYWVLFGLGAVVGPLLSGLLADRMGFGRALRLAYLIQALAVSLPAFGLGSAWLMLSSVVVGAFTPGIVPLVLGRVHQLLAHHPAEQKAAWSAATTSFAVMQAIAAYGMSYLFSRQAGDYRLLFVLGVAALLLALAIDLAAPRAARHS